MATLPGGAADKLGNRYEHRWVAYRVADVLKGAAGAIRMEPPGADGAGVEFILETGNGEWAEQVKHSDARWTLLRLRREGVLGAIKPQLLVGRNVRLVLSNDAHELKGLAERARIARDLLELKDSILTQPQLADLQNIAGIWEETEERAWLLLQRVYVEHHPSESLERLVNSTYEHLFAADPELVVNELRGLIDANLHKPLAAPQIWTHLESRGLKRRLIVGDDSVVAALGRTVDRHIRRVRASEAPKGKADRVEADQLVDLLDSQDARQIVVVDGRAGSGKSTVVADALIRLVEDGWSAAVVRMDGLDAGTTTAAALGRASGLAESPAVLLAGIAQDRPAVLVVDQLDAVSIYSGRMPDAFDAVADVLDEVGVVPNLKVVLVARTVDIENDPRLRQLTSAGANAQRFTVDRLELAAVEAAVGQLGGDPALIDNTTLELLRLPLHLAVFGLLPDEARLEKYRTLQELYERFTAEARREIENRVGPIDWPAITGRLVTHMSDHEVLIAPAAVLDPFSPAHIGALESRAILVRDGTQVGFFHETYFDFLFARTFVTAGEDLHTFLAESGQYLFRRAQTRQVLEYLANTDRARFRATVVDLLTSSQVRAHLREVVISSLRQLDASPEDWTAIEDIAWGEGPAARKLLNLLSAPRWFDAADTDGRWERWLEDPDDDHVDSATNQLIVAARERPRRAEQLVRPHIGASERWRLRLRALVQWSLEPGLTGLAVDLIARGDLDDARGAIASNSDFWSLIYQPVHDGDFAAGARLIGAYLQRGLDRSRADGSRDPFETEHLSTHSPSGDSMISDVAKGAPREFVDNVLPFVQVIVEDTAVARHADLLPSTSRWGFRYAGSDHGIDSALFAGLDESLRLLAAGDPNGIHETVRSLAQSTTDELCFLACRAYAVLGRADEALDWLLNDIRHLRLGWSDSPRWATRELIEAAAPDCGVPVLERLTAILMDYEPDWELTADARRFRGHAQFELLPAVPEARRTEAVQRRVGELVRKFGEAPPAAPEPIVAHFVGSPIRSEAAERMADGDWVKAFLKYKDRGTDWRGSVPVGGASQLAQVLGQRAAVEPARFAALALKFESEIPSSAFAAVIDNVAERVGVDVVERLCAHAASVAGSDVGRSVCRALEQRAADIGPSMIELLGTYADDPNPDHESARTLASSGQYFYGGDLEMAGLNSTRGHSAVALAAVLFKSPVHTDRVIPILTRLAADKIIAVRVCAAEAILPLLNHRPGRALDLADELFATSDPAIFQTRAVERLLIYSLMRDSDRFARHLVRSLGAGEPEAEHGGAAWAVMSIRGTVPAGVPDDVAGLSAHARRGAAKVFASNAADSTLQLTRLFDDNDEDARNQAARGMRHIAEVDPGDVDELIRSFIHSAAFGSELGDLVYALERLTTTLPAATIEALERAVEIAGAALGDIRTAHAAASRGLIAVVLRLYRQGDRDLRVRCLDVIDRLAELGAYDLENALKEER